MATKNLEFTERLEQAILESGLKKKAFCKKAEINYTTLMNYLAPGSRGRVPEWEQLIHIAIAAEKSIDWLLTGKENEPMPAIAEAKNAYNGNNDFMSGWPEDHRNDCLMLKEILDSGDKVAIAAIKSNLVAFHESIRKNSRIDKLEQDVHELKKAQASNPGTPAADAASITKRKAM